MPNAASSGSGKNGFSSFLLRHLRPTCSGVAECLPFGSLRSSTGRCSTPLPLSPEGVRERVIKREGGKEEGG